MKKAFRLITIFTAAVALFFTFASPAKVAYGWGDPPGIENSQLLYQYIPETMIAGKTYTLFFLYKNTGQSTWTKGNYTPYNKKTFRDPYALTALTPFYEKEWGAKVYIPMEEDVVAPGQVKVFSTKVTAPTVPGEYTLRYQMVRTGLCFGDPTSDLKVNVVMGTEALKPYSSK